MISIREFVGHAAKYLRETISYNNFSDGISVIITTYNSERCLEDTLKSVLAQTHSPLEILICDDCSSDNTMSIAHSFEDSRIKWARNKHHTGFPGTARNMGADLAKGRWLAFTDHDDVWHQDKLAVQLARAKQTGLSMVCSEALRNSPHEEHLNFIIGKQDCILTFLSLIENNAVICSSAFIEKNLFDLAGGFPTDFIYEDYAFWLRIASLTSIAFVAQPLVVYRDDAPNSIRGRPGTEEDRLICVINDYIQWASMSQRCNELYIKEARFKLDNLTVKKFSQYRQGN